MRISDWSSDVCSSDLVELDRQRQQVVLLATKGFGGAHRAEKIAWLGLGRRRRDRVGARLRCRRLGHIERGGGGVARRHHHGKPQGEDSVLEIGRASCRESVCQYV